MSWNYLDQQNQQHAVTADQLPALVRQGIVDRSTLVWREGMIEWMTLGEMEPDLFLAPAVPPPLPGPVSAGAIPLAFQPRTGPRAAAKPRRSGCRLRFLLLLVIVLLVLLGPLFYAALRGGGTASKYPAFAAADKAISGKDAVMTGGNTPAAKDAARLFGAQAEALRMVLIENKTSNPSSSLRKAAKALDGKEFSAWCQHQGDTAIFLLHVPGLRQFTDEAKTAMNSAAWLSAQMACATLPEPRPAKLYVAVKGVVLYDKLLRGRVLADSEYDAADSERPGMERESEGSTVDDILGPIFKAEEAPPARRPASRDGGQPAGPAPTGGTP